MVKETSGSGEKSDAREFPKASRTARETGQQSDNYNSQDTRTERRSRGAQESKNNYRKVQRVRERKTA